ncbi:MAG: phosphodiester glycosidase family protein [Oscillospiraceae bacterium]|nr:phosphodiester glycosidase family protein [Oscillospiraceae bacterium]
MREYDLDEILAEYADYTEEPEEEAVPAAEDLTAEPEPVSEESVETEPEEVREEAEMLPDAEPDPSLTQVFTPDDIRKAKADAAESADAEPGTGKKKEKKKAAAAEDPAPKPVTKKKKKKKESFLKRLGFGMLSLIFAFVSLVTLCWTLENVHPDTKSTTSTIRTAGTTNLVSRLDSSLNNSKAEALSDITFIPKHYSIPEGETVAPKPQESNFGSVSPENAAQVMDVIQQARDSGLLEGQEVIFNPELNFRKDTNIQYYCDETILTIVWKEIIDGNTVTCCEVKIADASQFRRKFVDDSFGSSNKLFATSLAASTNAVVAMNADFYMFRDFGIVVYDRELYRFGENVYTGNYMKYNCTDTLFITDTGDFLFWHRLQQATPDEMRALIADNNILFSIAFGPILVENGELTPCDWYPAGEIDRGYSRAGIGQKDHLHYFYMSLNHSPEKEARWTVNQFGARMYERGLQQAYCLDGGQTSEIVWRGAPFNYIDFGGEREVSDIIYFATAVPKSEGTP